MFRIEHIKTSMVIASVVAVAVLLAVGLSVRSPTPTMLILRGIADEKNPRGQLDDQSAMEYARRTGFRGEVLDVAGNTGPNSEQVKMALDRIRRDETVGAIYGFSGGAYNAKLIWRELTATERERMATVIVIGAPGVTVADFAGSSSVQIVSDPPEGHMTGPKALLNSVL
jgi:hypothetical protein